MESYLLPTVLAISILLQISAAITAILLVKTSGFYKSWICIASAITLMALRRIISLKNIILSGSIPNSAIGPEIVALIISIFMLTGLIMFRPVFNYIKKVQKDSDRKIKEQNMLMKESNHRIKNNLTIISSLINLKDSSLGDDIDLSDIAHQIDAIRIVHEKLYQSEDIIYIDLRDYFPDLIESIFSTFSSQHISINTNIDSIKFKTQNAVTLGLILNEFATNTIKYATASNSTTKMSIEMKDNKENNYYELALSNNGPAIPENVDMENPSSFGLRLMYALTSQLSGSLKVQKEPYPIFTFLFPKNNL